MSLLVRGLSLCLFTLAAFPFPGFAQSEPRYNAGSPTLQQIWVDPAGGNDRSSGRSADEAVRTLIEAWNRVPPNTAATPLAASGYEIRLQPGEYPADTIPHYMEQRYGSPTAPIVFRAVNGAGTATLRTGLNVAQGVNGGYNVLVAWNTLYRVGTRSHVLEVTFGHRSCDAADVVSERTACEVRIAEGGWGTTVVDDGDNYVRIPNRHVFLMNNVVFNPEGAGSQSGCPADHATCGEPYILANNALNTQQPTFTDLSAGNVRPTGALAGAGCVSIPDFSYGDLPPRPLVPAGATSNAILLDRYGKARGANDPPGAALPQ